MSHVALVAAVAPLLSCFVVVLRSLSRRLPSWNSSGARSRVGCLLCSARCRVVVVGVAHITNDTTGGARRCVSVYMLHAAHESHPTRNRRVRSYSLCCIRWLQLKQCTGYRAYIDRLRWPLFLFLSLSLFLSFSVLKKTTVFFPFLALVMTFIH